VAGTRPGEVVLVGAGDTTLTVSAPKPTDFPANASLEQLATATAASLRASGTTSVTVAVDDHLFTGPAVSPAWQPTYVSAGVVSPVSALTLDAGRLGPHSDQRAKDPALRTGQELARLLRRAGVTVGGTVTRDQAPPAGAVLGAVSSPDIASLVESALSTSDNDLAESLARLVAVARHQPATFDGAEAAVTAVLTEMGVPTEGMELLDGSGLARGSRVAPETLGRLLALAAAGPDPRLRPLVTALPVAGFTGTLADRFETAPTRPGAGVVRAKTGTLTGVASLVGIGTTGSGSGTRVLAFALLADNVPARSTLAARDALDRAATALVR
jgi:D-alanyl-D-alanine carboxypeptidase/D-alanyl-D-alanine-endopeptidase (penicillin-binding protein 4)